MSRIVWSVAVVTGLGLVAGCGDSKSSRPIGEERKAGLEELGQMLKALADEGKKPPARPADLDALDPLIPVAGPAVRNGEIVYAWGAGYVSGGNLVVAYDKKAADEGGYVLLQDGTVKHLSASEFQSAPKAK